MKKKYGKRILCGFLISLFLGAHVYLGRVAIKELSPTFDEPVHLTAGCIYLKTALYRYIGLDTPPFAQMWAAFPLLFLNVEIPREHPLWRAQKWRSPEQYQFANDFLYKNRVSWDRLLTAGRSMQLLLSVLFGIFLACFAWSLGGPQAAVYAVGFWAFCPTFLAHATLTTTDLAFAVFFFVFFCLLGYTNRIGGILAAGVALGLCAGSKYFAIALVPCLGGLFLWKWIRNDFVFSKREAQVWFLIAAIGFMTLCATYQFTKLSLFERGVRYAFRRAQGGQTTFFWGHVSSSGSFFYLPFSFLVKSPFPFLIALVLVLQNVFKRKLSIPSRLIVPPLIFFIVLCFSKKQIGHRYLLTVYPFLYLAIGVGLAQLNKKRIVLPLILLTWTLFETWRVKPYYLSFFNQIVGGPKEGYKYLVDSNVDWGQGLKALRSSLNDEDMRNGIFLSYFGVADPHSYGIRYINLTPAEFPRQEDDSAQVNLRPTKFAISATQWQLTYRGGTHGLEWLKNYKPGKQVAYSIFLYDFSKNPDALEKLKEMQVKVASAKSI